MIKTTVPKYFKEPFIFRFWIGQSLSSFGNNLIPVTITFAVLSLNHSVLSISGILTSLWGGRIIFQLFGGIVSDRWNRLKLLIALDYIQSFILAIVAVLFFLHEAKIGYLLIEAALEGVCQALYQPTVTGLRQTIVPKIYRGKVISLQSLTNNLTRLIAPLIAVILVHFIGYWLVFLLDSISFIISALSLTGISTTRRIDLNTKTTNFFVDLRESWNAVIIYKWIIWLAAASSITNMITASYSVVVPLVLNNSSEGIITWGFLSTINAAGSILGGMVGYDRIRRYPFIIPKVLIAITMPIVFVSIALHGPLYLLIIPVAGMAMGLTLSNITFDTVLSNEIPESLIGRIDSFDTALSDALIPLGFIVSGVLTQFIGYRLVLLLMAVLAVIANGGVLFFKSIRSTHFHPYN
ncbi:MFS transporter [Sulfoacidibacillus thermotolerans]|uniref:Major facilitator superfamily (MFS) profile domain-containing protein n=1 Tax=Sulfoacidibacillus thermotolerans TaxID=1765684 RepID=A0A2U3D8A9_SULT2|nr:MFS transporter [Sulfoacidibacillus thermotolerans]PWI57505.1 hypothetical protein BM613_08525 [Sulfoacidibacillus thermotolerans]